jgi:hypothetical protein
VISGLLQSIDVIGLAAFGIALVYSAMNNRITRFASSIWWGFSIFCLAGMAWAAFSLLGDSDTSFVMFSFMAGFFSCLLFMSIREPIKLI